MPQPLLARCAGALTAHGHDTTVIDEGTVDALGAAIDGELSQSLRQLVDGASPPAQHWPARFFGKHRRPGPSLARFAQRRVERAVEHGADGKVPPDLAILFGQRHKDGVEIRRLARGLRARWPDLCIAIAGNLAIRFGHHLMELLPEVDVACVAFPESCIPGLAARWNDRRAWRKIPGLLSRSASDLHEVPADGSMALASNLRPAYHPGIYPSLLYGGKFQLFTLGQAWGLSHVGHYRDGRHSNLRTRPARQLRLEMVELHELYGAQTFHIAGEHTPCDAVQEFSRECMTLPFPVAYSRDAHVYEIAASAVPALSASGCRALGFSLLTGSQRNLTDYFGENWTIGDVEACLRPCREAGLFVHADFIHPVPADDFHTRAETIRLLHRCRPNSLRLLLPTLVPGSAWYQHAAEFDFSLQHKRLLAWLGAAVLCMNTSQEASLLPYTFSGGRGRPIAQMPDAFEVELEGFSPPIDSGCQAGLVARVSGREGREAAFIQDLERALKTLDIVRLRAFVDTFNLHATATINTIDSYPSRSERQAVGN